MKVADFGSIRANWTGKIAQMAVIALAATTPIAAAHGRSTSTLPILDFYCEYGDKDPSRRQSEGFNFSFKPDIPYDFIDMFGFGHSISSTSVTPDQVVQQMVALNDSAHPTRTESFGVIVMDRRTMKFRRQIYSIDQKTRDQKVEMDRSGQCTPVKPRAAK
jgi:hypothetical protein